MLSPGLLLLPLGSPCVCVIKSTRVIASPLGSNNPKVFSFHSFELLGASLCQEFFSLMFRIIQPWGLRQMRFEGNIVVYSKNGYVHLFFTSFFLQRGRNWYKLPWQRPLTWISTVVIGQLLKNKYDVSRTSRIFFHMVFILVHQLIVVVVENSRFVPRY